MKKKMHLIKNCLISKKESKKLTQNGHNIQITYICYNLLANQADRLYAQLYIFTIRYINGKNYFAKFCQKMKIFSNRFEKLDTHIV